MFCWLDLILQRKHFWGVTRIVVEVIHYTAKPIQHVGFQIRLLLPSRFLTSCLLNPPPIISLSLLFGNLSLHINALDLCGLIMTFTVHHLYTLKGLTSSNIHEYVGEGRDASLTNTPPPLFPSAC